MGGWNNMGTFFNSFFGQDNRTFNDGYRACYEKYSSMVKKLGKRYYKSFVDQTKNIDEVIFTSTTSTHKCNCEYCDWDIKE